MSEESEELITNAPVLPDINDMGYVTHMLTQARMNPRDVKKVLTDVMTLVSINSDTAAKCFYELPRGGQSVRGPSIRLAEIFLSCWGNMQVGSKIVSTDGKDDRMVESTAFAWDLEKNVSMGVSVRSPTIDRYGRPFHKDLRVQIENATCSKALRNVVFRMIPRSLVDMVCEHCVQLACMPAGERSISEEQKHMLLDIKIREVLRRLEVLGIPPLRILEYFDVTSTAQLNQEHLGILIGAGTALKEGHLRAEDAFTRSSAACDNGQRLLDQLEVQTREDRQER